MTSTTVGYTGGIFKNPTYKDVCGGLTGHAESVQVDYDPTVVSYSQLLDAFFKLHDPTGMVIFPRGQYRSAIFYHTGEQYELAHKAVAELTRKLGRNVNTEIILAPTFYRAEEYHQHYYQKQGVGVCHI